MSIYFVQHEEALPKEIDPERGLTEKGIAGLFMICGTRKAAAYLAKRQLPIKRVCHSGKKRALPTAEIFSSIVGIQEISQSGGMGPNDNVRDFSKGLKDDTMYVGHLPHLGKLVSLLLTGDENSGTVAVTNSRVIGIEQIESGYPLIFHLPAFILA